MMNDKALIAFCFLAASCGPPPGGDDGGSAVLSVALSAGDVSRVEASISGDGIEPAIVERLSLAGGRATGTISGIPAGSDRLFELRALDSLGRLLCAGSARADIVAATVARVSIVLHCIGDSAPTGGAEINVELDSPPIIGPLFASTTTVLAGGTIDLRVSASDPDPGDSIGFAWTAPAGAFAPPNAPETTWTAPSTAGTVTLLVTASDGRGGVASRSLDVTVSALSTWIDLGSGSPLLDRTGAPGAMIRPTFSDAARPGLMTGLICDRAIDPVTCRPATSTDQGATWSLHDAPAFAEIAANGWGWWPPAAARSPADPNRLYFSVAGHPWTSVEPKGGLWRSDDGGRTWTANLFAGHPGESGMIPMVIPDRDDRDLVYINRGYDFGNVSVSRDAGGSFSIICGHDNVSKSGNDVVCGMGGGTLVMDLAGGQLAFKHYFHTSGVRLGLDGSGLVELPFPGLGWSETAGLGFNTNHLDLPIRGLANRAGGASVRVTADGASILYLVTGLGGTTVMQSAPDFSFGAPLNGPTPGGAGIVLTHPVEACTWILQTGDRAFSRTRDCGGSWAEIASDGLAAEGRIISAAIAPDGSRLVAFTDAGGRFATAP